MRLLSPQHWAQELVKQGDRNAARLPKVITDSKRMTLLWNNQDSKLTVDLDQTNVANVYLAPGFDKYKLFLQNACMEDDSDPLLLEDALDEPEVIEIMHTNIVSDDEQSEDSHPDDHSFNAGWDADEPEGEDTAVQEAEPRQISFDIAPTDEATSETMIVPPDDEDKAETLASELLRVHHQFNHIGFNKLRVMA